MYKMKKQRLPKDFYCLVLDTETHMRSENQNLIYDIGGCFGNLRSDDDPITFRWFVEEHIAPSFWNWSFKGDSEIRTPYRFDGRADSVYHQARKNPCSTISMDEMFRRLTNYINQAQAVSSWNWGFDSRAINATWKRKHHSDFMPLIQAQKKAGCWRDVFHSLEVNRTYYAWLKTLDENERGQFLTENGNIATRAETAGRKFSLDSYYVEAHESLDDAVLEYGHARTLFRKHARDILFGRQIAESDKRTREFLGYVKIPNWRQNQKELSSSEKLIIRGSVKIPQSEIQLIA